MIYVSVDGWGFVITIQNLDNKNLECFKEFFFFKNHRNLWIRISSFYFLHEVVFFRRSNFVFFLRKIIEVFEFKQIINTNRNQTFEYKWVVRITIFFFSILYVRWYYYFNIFCREKKIKPKGILFQNLYENILIHQKLKTKHRNPLINSIEDNFFIILFWVKYRSKRPANFPPVFSFQRRRQTIAPLSKI